MCRSHVKGSENVVSSRGWWEPMYILRITLLFDPRCIVKVAMHILLYILTQVIAIQTHRAICPKHHNARLPSCTPWINVRLLQDRLRLCTTRWAYREYVRQGATLLLAARFTRKPVYITSVRLCVVCKDMLIKNLNSKISQGHSRKIRWPLPEK